MAKEEKEQLFFKREDIRTMQKDILRLREKEAVSERERLARLKTKEEIEREKKMLEQIKKEKEEREKIKEERELKEEITERAKKRELEEIRKKEEIEKQRMLEEKRRQAERAWQIEEEERKKMLKRLLGTELARRKKIPARPKKILVPRPVVRPSATQKIFIRILVLILFFGVLGLLFGFWYWYFKERPVPSLPPPPIFEEKPLEIPEETPEEILEETTPSKEEISPPVSLISVSSTEVLEISEGKKIEDLFNEFLEKDFEEGSIIRLVFKDLSLNQFISLRDLFEGFLVEWPEGFYQALEENYTFFVFYQKEGKRWGLIGEIKEEKKEEFVELLKGLEPTLEENLKGLYLPLGKKDPALSPVFKEGTHQTINYRFQTFSRQDLGICYSVFDDHFLLTSSLSGLTRAIDLLVGSQQQ